MGRKGFRDWRGPEPTGFPSPTHTAPLLPITFHFPPCGSLELSHGSKVALSFWILKPETLELSTLYPTHSQAVSPVSPTFKTCGRLGYFSPSMGLVLAPAMSGLG